MDNVEVYSLNLLAYLHMLGVPFEYQINADNKVFGLVDREYLDVYVASKKLYKDDIKLREFLEAFKEVKLNCIDMKLGYLK